MRLAKNAESLPANMPVGKALKLVAKVKEKPAASPKPKPTAKPKPKEGEPKTDTPEARLFHAIAEAIDAYGEDEALEMIGEALDLLTSYPLAIRFEPNLQCMA